MKQPLTVRLEPEVRAKAEKDARRILGSINLNAYINYLILNNNNDDV
jgi:hypothetical protein